MKIAILTPLAGGTERGVYSAQYLEALLAFARDPSVELLARVNVDTDLVRARSRAVQLFLTLGAEYTHALWWDADVVADPGRVAACVRGMLATGHDVIGAPYPFKRYNWAAARGAEDPEAAAVGYPLAVNAPGDALHEGLVRAVNGAVEVTAIPLGFTLTSRDCLALMAEHYYAALRFEDIRGGERVPTVALFLQEIVGSVLLSEDYSFCHRWRQIGGKVHVYVGDGAPLDHHGSCVYRGIRGGLFREADTVPAPPGGSCTGS